MLLSAIRTGSLIQIIMALLASAFVIFCALPLHEYAHGFAAYKLGDNTAKLRGRLTLNPMAHISPVGAVMLTLVGFGWGNPCPIDSRNFKNEKVGTAITAFAGPLSNILLAFIMILGMVITDHFGNPSSNLVIALSLFFYLAAEINIILAVFNLIPVPPLDGYRILSVFLPDKAYYWFIKNEQIISIVLIVLIISGILSTPLSALSSLLFKGLYYLASLPF